MKHTLSFVLLTGAVVALSSCETCYTCSQEYVEYANVRVYQSEYSDSTGVTWADYKEAILALDGTAGTDTKETCEDTEKDTHTTGGYSCVEKE